MVINGNVAEDSLCSIFESNPHDLFILDSLLTTGGVLLSLHDVKLAHEFNPCVCVDDSLLTINGNSILSLDDDEKCVLWNDGLLPCTCEKLKPYLFVDVSLTGDGEFLSRSKPSIAADGDGDGDNDGGMWYISSRGDDDDDGGVRSPWISDDAGDEGVM